MICAYDMSLCLCGGGVVCLCEDPHDLSTCIFVSVWVAAGVCAVDVRMM